MKDSNTVVGLDVHKNSIQIVTADTDGAMEVRHFGRIGGTMDALDRAVRKLVSGGSTLRFVYEAGPCGYEIYRHLTGKGFACKVVAPSKTPKKSGDRIKNDRRDAETLARLERAPRTRRLRRSAHRSAGRQPRRPAAAVRRRARR